jgi:cytoskeletal protein CcmA (bactofilin family)
MPFWNKPREETITSEPGASGQPEAEPPPEHEEPKSMAMLKRDEITSAGSTGSGDLNALLGRGSEFDGKLTFEGTVRIDGKFTGSINTGDVLVVGEGAKISAEIICGTIIVHGEVNGNIKAKTAIELHHPAKVRGNIETPSLMIEKGVLFEGQSKMENLEKGGGFKSSTASTSSSSSSNASGPIPTPAPISAAPKT